MAVKFEDFKPVEGHDNYVIRDLGEDYVGPGQWFELTRVDGWGFGAVPSAEVERYIAADEKNPIPSTGTTLAAAFGASEEPAAQ